MREKCSILKGRMETGEMRMLGGEWRVVRFWHSELEMVDAQQLWMGNGGRTAVMDGKWWTHSSVGWERMDAQQCVPTISLITIY